MEEGTFGSGPYVEVSIGLFTQEGFSWHFLSFTAILSKWERMLSSMQPILAFSPAAVSAGPFPRCRAAGPGTPGSLPGPGALPDGAVGIDGQLRIEGEIHHPHRRSHLAGRPKGRTEPAGQLLCHGPGTGSVARLPVQRLSPHFGRHLWLPESRSLGCRPGSGSGFLEKS